MLDLRIDLPGIDLLERTLDLAPHIVRQEVVNGMERATLVAEREIVKRTPTSKTRPGGGLRGSIMTRVDDRGNVVQGTVGTSTSYGPWVEGDTRPHKIEARKAKALAFHPVVGFRLVRQEGKLVRGQALYRIQTGRRAGKVTTRRGGGALGGETTSIIRKSVKHPGTTGQHMFRDGTRAAAPRIRDIFLASLVRAVRRIQGGGA